MKALKKTALELTETNAKAMYILQYGKLSCWSQKRDRYWWTPEDGFSVVNVHKHTGLACARLVHLIRQQQSGQAPTNAKWTAVPILLLHGQNYQTLQGPASPVWTFQKDWQKSHPLDFRGWSFYSFCVRTARDGLQQKRPEEDLCGIIPHVAGWPNRSVDWSQLSAGVPTNSETDMMKDHPRLRASFF